MNKILDKTLKLWPESQEEKSEWISATKVRNFTKEDCILDFLDLYGESNGFTKDSSLPWYNKNTDFTEFIFEKGKKFEDNVIRVLKDKDFSITEVLSDYREIWNPDMLKKTLEVMEKGAEIIYQGVLMHGASKTYGTPDLMVRSDIINKIVLDTIPEEEVSEPAVELGDNPWHYVVIDVKFTGLRFNSKGTVLDGKHAAYMLQCWLYNRALGELQGYLPKHSWVLGRSWLREFTKDGQKQREGDKNCFARLGPVPHSGDIKKEPIEDKVETALEWVTRLRRKGRDWQVLPKPTVPELYPNMSNTQDMPWHAAKSQIAHELAEISLVWQAGISGRILAHQNGVLRWDSEECISSVIKKNPNTDTAKKMEVVLEVNRSEDGPTIYPKKITAGREILDDKQVPEFYVDFETVNDINDTFENLPDKGGQTLIFMIGCGHEKNGKWIFKGFTADRMTEDSEAEIIDEWLDYMKSITAKMNSGIETPRCYHWSAAEDSFLSNQFNAAMRRHPDKDWHRPNWYDLLQNIVRTEPVIVKGALKFGLKIFAKAMHSHGMIETNWDSDSSVSDGMAAMVAAWRGDEEAAEKKCSLIELPVMQEVLSYNEVDCKVMWEILKFLRENH